MTLDQLKFQREALQEQLRLVEFRIERMEEALSTEQRIARDTYPNQQPRAAALKAP